MKVSVDVDRCQGHARCSALCPEVFELDDLGFATKTQDRTVLPELEEKVRLAQRACPEDAVVVTV